MEGSYSSPAHLLTESWVDFELRAALNSLAAMQSELKKLKMRVIKERVHKSRVSLRRWFSVWEFLAEDGWEEKKFRKKILAPLREFLAELGDLRDCDVSIETAEKLECDIVTLEDFKKTRKKLKRRIEKGLLELNAERLAERIGCYLETKAVQLREEMNSSPEQDHSAFARFDRYLSAHEEQVKKLSLKAESPEALHKLRLAVKRWRYLLTECMGLTNLELVNAQTLLGEIHDYDRLEPVILKDEGENSVSLVRLRHERAELEKKFKRLKNDLPYGLRPGSVSYAAPGRDFHK